MKSEREMVAAIEKCEGANEYPGMTYEQGVEDALRWVMGEIADDEFEYA